MYCDNSMGSRIAIVYGPEQKFTLFDRAEEEANARLIASAPELLACLRWYVENDDTNIGEEGNEFWEDGLNIARHVIAKATGEAR